METKKEYQQFKKDLDSPKLQTNTPLKNHTYFKIGGPADLFYPASTQAELTKVSHLAFRHQIPFHILGSGSNILVTDQGCRGLIIKNKSRQITSSKAPQASYTLLEADSGLPANQLIRYTIKNGLTGLAPFLGLPGTVGGAVYNNSHHLDQLIGEHIHQVKAITSQGQLKTYPQNELDFAYDYSIFHQNQDIILSATFKLKKGNPQELEKIGQQAVQRRANTQPLGLPSSGCIFQNITQKQAQDRDLPTQSTGYLIDQANLKGTTIGGAQISKKHANFIVNKNNATFQDVQQLINLIRQKLKEKYQLTPKLEIFILGET